MDEIHEFFAVTQTSVYRVTDEDGENGWPIVEKIALMGESEIPIGRRLTDGYNVGIMKKGIVMFSSSKRHREPELVNVYYWGGKTSSIIALFLKKNKAMECFNSENTTVCDPRWKNETLETLGKIGNDHSVFILSRTEGLSRCY